MREPVDIIMLTFNRLDHLIATVDALEGNTPEPYRLTIVDNASGADVRSWLSANRHRFHQLLLRPTNEHLPAFQHGIDATTSDPYILCEPDLLVPAPDPSWLARLLELMDEHPDFGIIGMGLEEGNRPSVLGPEVIDPATRVGEHLVEGNLGMWFQTIRRDALRVPYELDAQACEAVRSAGFRVGWTDTLRAWHLGWDDHKTHPGHLASKNPKVNKAYSHYREIELIGRPPTLTELANAAPVAAATRAAGIPDASILELSFGEPTVAAALKGPICLHRPEHGALGVAAGGAGAVALMDPPVDRAADALAEAFRVAAHTVVAVARLAAFGGRFAGDLAPEGWTAQELPGPGAVALALAAAADADPALADKLGYRVIEEREHWLALFAAGAFGAEERRVWIWRREQPLPIPAAVAYDTGRVTPWQPEAPAVPAPPRRTLAMRARGKLQRAALRRRVRAARTS